MESYYHKLNCQIDFLNLTSQKKIFNPNFVLCTVLSGALSAQTRNKQFLCQMGEILFFQPQQPFQLQKVNEQCEVMILSIHPIFFQNIFPDLESKIFLAPIQLQDFYLQDCIWKSGLSFLSKKNGWELLCISHINRLFFYLIQQFPLTDNQIKNSTERLSQILQYCHDHYSQKFSVQALAETLELSASYLSHYFKDTTGISIQEYICRLRIDHACRMIQTQHEKSLSEICFASGFSDYRYFSQEFKRRYHCTAQQFRQSIHHLDHFSFQNDQISSLIAKPLPNSYALQLLQSLSKTHYAFPTEPNNSIF